MTLKRIDRRLVPRPGRVGGDEYLVQGKVVPILSSGELIQLAITASLSYAPKGAVQVARKTILVAEDSITSRTLLKNVLESAGYDVTTAVDGAEAMAALKRADFDLLISDVEMPAMNGFDLTTQIRHDKRLADLPVILVTSLGSRKDKERGVEAGANAYIVKMSFDQGTLLDVIRRLI